MRQETIALFVASLAALSTARAARADDRPSVVLRYDVSRAEASCPDEASFKNLVAARLGYEPFAAAAADRVDVEIVRTGASLRGRASVERAGGRAPGAREISGQPHECEALVAALATTVAIALDPVRAMSGAEPFVEASPRPAEPPALDRRPEPPPPGERERVHLHGVASGVASVAVAPTVTLGGEIGAELGYGAFSIGLLGRVEATPGATEVSSGDHLEATIFTASVVPCGNLGGFRACAFARVGAFQGEATNVVHPVLQTSTFAAVGVRTGYVLDLTPVFSLRADLELGFPLVRTELGVDGAVVWTASPVTGGLSLGAGVRFM